MMNSTLLNKNSVSEYIKNYWEQFFGIKDFSKIGPLKMVKHNSKNLEKNEIFILAYDKKYIISFPENIYEKASKPTTINHLNINKIKAEIEKITNKTCVIVGPMIVFYLFSSHKLLPKSEIVQKLKTKQEKVLFEEFMQGCLEKDKDAVQMEFSNAKNKVFGIYEKGKLVCLGNYVIDRKTKTGFIGVITHHVHKKKGYGKQMVSNLIWEILDDNLVPFYRVSEKNNASINLALSLGFSQEVKNIAIDF